MNAGSGSKRPGPLARASAAVIRRALRLRAVRAWLLYSQRRGPVLADAVTYRALFSVFAGVLLGFSIAALWLAGNETAWNAVVSAVETAVPGLLKTSDGSGIVDPKAILVPTGLSITGIVSLVGLIGSALGAIGSLRVAIGAIAGTTVAEEPAYRVIVRNVALALIIGGSFLVSAALTFAGEAVLRWVAGMLGLPEDSAGVSWTVRLLSLLVVLALDAVLVAAAFRMLSGLRPAARSLWSGALIGGAALLVLQELSGLFVGGAKSNPLLASFASLLALLLWLNLSAQVILVASAWIVTAEDERQDRVHARYGADTLAQKTLRLAEQDAQAASRALRAAQRAASGS
ncbi:YhjD/YihY/BrkB family envelope integrity protein [Microbacterium sp.]|uniref:YhjD/YihY/BrkB family envelope integrity protein n=1 Tax=Microbacterium sp. TaxID=51671 RepID=UPI0039E3B941